MSNKKSSFTYSPLTKSGRSELHLQYQHHRKRLQKIYHRKSSSSSQSIKTPRKKIQKVTVKVKTKKRHEKTKDLRRKLFDKIKTPLRSLKNKHKIVKSYSSLSLLKRMNLKFNEKDESKKKETNLRRSSSVPYGLNKKSRGRIKPEKIAEYDFEKELNSLKEEIDDLKYGVVKKLNDEDKGIYDSFIEMLEKRSEKERRLIIWQIKYDIADNEVRKEMD